MLTVRFTGLMCLVVFFSGCGRATTGQSKLTANIGNREVKATIDGAAFIATKGETFEVSFKGGKILVEKEKILLDDREIAKVPADAAKVEMDIAAGGLQVKADGTKVYSGKVR